MKFKRFKFVIILLIFSMLFGGILPASECLAKDVEDGLIYFIDQCPAAPKYYFHEIRHEDDGGLIDFGEAAYFKNEFYPNINNGDEKYKVEIVLDLESGYVLEKCDGGKNICIAIAGDEKGPKYRLNDFTLSLNIPFDINYYPNHVEGKTGDVYTFEAVSIEMWDKSLDYYLNQNYIKNESAILITLEGDANYKSAIDKYLMNRFLAGSTSEPYDLSFLNLAEATYTSTSKVYVPKKELTLENMIALTLNGFSWALNGLVSLSIGEQVTIDHLVFNHYPDTELTYFEKAPTDIEVQRGEYSEIIWGIKDASGHATGEGGLHKTVNTWYAFFRKIAIVGYMVILVYMGIRIMMSSTGEKVAQYKTLFMYWVIGVAILFFAPYFMKYAIELNNTVVKLCDEYKGKAIAEASSGEIKEIVYAPIKNVTKDSLYVDFDANPFTEPTINDGEAIDYMSKMAKDAYSTLRFAVAFTYLMLTWQLITLIIHYYRRLMITGFLIVIFPIVTLSYAIDKIADGKSQGFNKWLKEYILNVFIQSFHAIIYVFVCCTVYASMGNPKTGEGTDYVLAIVGGTFLFTGEEIIKKIFSQESNTATKSLAATAAKTAAVVGGAKLLKGAFDNTVGKNNPVSRINTIRNTWKSSDARANAANIFANAKSTELRSNRDSAIANINNDNSLTEDQKTAARTAVTNVANSIDMLKNPNNHTSEELATAYATVLNATNGKGADPAVAAVVQANTREMLNNSGISEDQLNAMAAAEQVAAQMVAEGITDTVEIKRRVKAELAYVFEGMDESQKAKYEKMIITHMALFGVNRGFTWQSTVDDVNRAKEKAKEYIAEVENMTNYDDDDEDYDEGTDHNFYERRATAINILEVNGFEKSDENIEMINSILTLNNRRGNTLESNFKAYEYIKAHKDDNDETRLIYSMLELTKNEDGEFDEPDDEDFDAFGHVLASKTATDERSSEESKKEARKLRDEFERHSRDGYYDDEISIHEVIRNLRQGKDERMDRMTTRVYNARRHSNQMELEITRAIGTDMLIEEYGDIYEDATESQFYFDGMTREDILKHRKKATQNLWAAYLTAGIIKPNDTTARYSKGFFENDNSNNTNS